MQEIFNDHHRFCKRRFSEKLETSKLNVKNIEIWNIIYRDSER